MFSKATDQCESSIDTQSHQNSEKVLSRDSVSKNEARPSVQSLRSSDLHSLVRRSSFSEIVSRSWSMQRVFSVVDKVAKTNCTVLVLGESGTGKELIASAIHRLSGRPGRLVPVNCGAIPEEILESELFGHEKGSFTGAIASRQGRFQLADEGTIFLDEIGEMSPKLQVKLLRVLQERKVDPVGSNRSIDVNVRVIAATNKDLNEEVKKGRFREDLFYRLQVVPVELPPLRQRHDDSILLAEWFMQRSCQRLGRAPITFSSEVIAAFQQYQWPGNVRELENLVERLSILSDDSCLQLSDLPAHLLKDLVIAGREIFDDGSGGALMQRLDSQATFDLSSLVNARPNLAKRETIIYEDLPLDGVDFNLLVDQFESRLITLALSRTNGNKKAAAELLQLNRTTLVEKIRKKGMDSSLKGSPEQEEYIA